MQGDLSFMSVTFDRQMSQFMDGRQALANGRGIQTRRRDHADDRGMRLGSNAQDMKIGDPHITRELDEIANFLLDMSVGPIEQHARGVAHQAP